MLENLVDQKLQAYVRKITRLAYCAMGQSDPRLLHMHTSQHEYNTWKQCIHCFPIGIHCNNEHYTTAWSYYPGDSSQVLDDSDWIKMTVTK